MLLAAEVLVDECFRDTGCSRDVVGAHLLVAALAEHPACGGENAGASLRPRQAPARDAVLPDGAAIQGRVCAAARGGLTHVS